MFRKALLRLTLQYSVLLLGIFTLFSGGIYEYMNYTFGGDYHHAESSLVENSKAQGAAEAADAGLDKLKYALIFSYLVLVIILPIISYYLAKRALGPVKKSYEEQQRFVDDASHELRTPLSIVQGELELTLKKPRSPKQYKASIQTSLEEVGNLNGLVNNLLLMARGSRAEFSEVTSSVRLDEIVLESIGKATRAYAAKHLTFDTMTSDITITGVESLIGQAVYNLLDNAAKFSDSQATIQVKLAARDGFVAVTVSDSGTGMTDEQLSRAFDRFWRADNARSVRGFGLGLSLVRQIMELHGGTVTIERNDNSGITAILRFPA